jgi:hypothetical protein
MKCQLGIQLSGSFFPGFLSASSVSLEWAAAVSLILDDHLAFLTASVFAYGVIS